MDVDNARTTNSQRSALVAVALRDTATPLLQNVTESLGWRSPSREETREGAVSSYFAKALHSYGSRLAVLTIRFTSEGEPTIDLRVNCELADAEIFNAERIVRVETVDSDEVQEWIVTQLERCTNVLLGRVKAR